MRPTHKGFRLAIHSALALLPLAKPAAAAPPAAGPVNLLILGDSLTAGYGLPASAGFQAQLAAALRAHGRDVTLIDGAVSGDTTTDAAARLDWILAGPKPDAALVELGGNDGLRGLDPAAMQRNLTYILDTLAAQKIPVLLTGMIAPPSYGPAYSAQFSAVYTALSHRPGLLFDPFFLANLPGHETLIQQDGIHPNAAGVRIEVTRLLPLIDRLLDEVPPR
jgi:acyl-CoA thioesterase-1